MLKEKEIAAHNKKAEIEQLTATFKQQQGILENEIAQLKGDLQKLGSSKEGALLDA